MDQDLSDVYLQYAELLSETASTEITLRNQKRALEDIKKQMCSPESDGGYGVEITSHAFKQIAERLEALALENTAIYKDAFNSDDPSRSYLLPSNLKAFVVTMIANARKKGTFTREQSRGNSGGVEFHYTVIIKEWSGNKQLEFTGIVESNYVKTCYFNWI